MRAIDGTTYKGRDVRCNDADDTGKPARRSAKKDDNGGRRKNNNTDDYAKFEKKSKRKSAAKDYTNDGFSDNGNETDWRQFFRNNNTKLVGEEPDFSEEGWARRKPKKK